MALILFVLPAYKYRFLDLMPIAHRHIFDNIPDGVVFLKDNHLLYGYNESFKTMFPIITSHSYLDDFISKLDFENENDGLLFRDYIQLNKNHFTVLLKNNLAYKVFSKRTNNNHVIIRFTDISTHMILKKQLNHYNNELAQKNKKLESLSHSIQELAITRARTIIARDIHDILGHSMTVVIGITDLASNDHDKNKAMERLSYVNELLTNSIVDLRGTLEGRPIPPQHTSLINAIYALKNDSINLDFSVQGNPVELNSLDTEAIFRVCQESITNSIKHGKANNILINLRFKKNELELYIIDDGTGCKKIIDGFGLNGMKARIKEISGNITVGSDGEKGFNIHIKIPIHS